MIMLSVCDAEFFGRLKTGDIAREMFSAVITLFCIVCRSRVTF